MARTTGATADSCVLRIRLTQLSYNTQQPDKRSTR